MNNFSVSIDWRSVVALGGSVVCIIFASKMSADAVERVLIHAVDASKDLAIAGNGNR